MQTHTMYVLKLYFCNKKPVHAIVWTDFCYENHLAVGDGYDAVARQDKGLLKEVKKLE